MKCPNPNFKCHSNSFRALYSNNSSDNLENWTHNHFECNKCGYNFNEWVNVSINQLKKVFGPNWEIYS